MVGACSSAPGKADYYCAGFDEGVTVSNNTANSIGFAGQIEVECDLRLEVLPREPSRAEVWCIGWWNGYMTVAWHHDPTINPTPADRIATIEGCIADPFVQEAVAKLTDPIHQPVDG